MHTFPVLETGNMNEIIVRPGESIQKAINKATPGTIIRVKAGTYREALSFQRYDVADSNTTPEKPIVLLSDDGPGKAIIKPPNGTQQPTIWLRLGNTVVQGFQILGTANFDGDNAPLKIFSKQGNILIKDNYLRSTAEDVIKIGLSQGISLIGNTLDTGPTKRWKDSLPDNYLKDSAIDIVHAKDITIKHNDFIGNVATGITTKSGTYNVDIFNNHFTGKYLGPAIKIGGRGDSFRNQNPWDVAMLGHEARDIRVRENVIEGEYFWNYATHIRGGQDSLIENNFIAPDDKDQVALYVSEQATSSNWSRYYDNKEGWFHSENIDFIGNILSENVKDGYALDALTPDENGKFLPENQGFVERDNDTGTLQDVKFSFGTGDLPTEPVDETPAPIPSDEQLIGEYGRLNVNQKWQTISLDNNYINPVVIVSDPTFKGSDPAAVRVRNVTDNTFQFRLQEPNYKDGWHTQESVAYVVMEAGNWILADGTRISADTHKTSRLTSKGFDAINLKGFKKMPTVLSQVQTFNGSDWVTTRTTGQSASRFQLAMQEEEALNNGKHLEETVGWLAVEVGVASDGDTLLQSGMTRRSYDADRSTVRFEKAFNAAPSLIAKLSSYAGTDTANLRLDNITTSSFGARVHEEQSLDSELNHTTESLSFLALQSKSGSLQGLSA